MVVDGLFPKKHVAFKVFDNQYLFVKRMITIHNMSAPHDGNLKIKGGLFSSYI
jgi:hypothetical protein